MRKRHAVRLTDDERAALQQQEASPLTRRQRYRVQVLLRADAGDTDEEIAEEVGASVGTVADVRRRFDAGGLDAALNGRPRPGAKPALDGEAEALAIATAGSPVPQGRATWAARMLADRLAELQVVASVSEGTVLRVLKRVTPSRGRRRRGACPGAVDGEFVHRMEDVLELYAEPHDPARPVVCFDEASKELRGDVAEPVPPAPGTPARQDYEYTRHGTANLFVIVEPLAGRRHLTVTDRRATPDFAAQMKMLCDELYPEATTIRVVLDNLNTHAFGSLFATYPPDEAWRLARRLEFHFTPKHASWLNMAECELSVLSRQCLDRRLSSREAVAAEVAQWEETRNRTGVKLVWSFRVADARRKLAHLYPQPSER